MHLGEYDVTKQESWIYQYIKPVQLMIETHIIDPKQKHPQYKLICFYNMLYNII